MDVLKVDYRAANAGLQLTESLKNSGFAVLTNHPIDLTLINEVYDEWRQFFASSNKMNYLYQPPKQDGYVPTTVAEKAKGAEVIDLKEFYSFYPWGKFPSELSQRTQKLYAQLNTLATQLLNWVEAHTPVEIRSKFSEPLSQMIANSPLTMLRIIHYPPFTGNEQSGAIRAASHEDIDLLTLLVGATDAGLQLQNDKGQWQDVPCDETMIVINVGDMLQMCSDHYFISTTHRVVNPEGEAKRRSRLSMPLFLHPREEVRLSDKYTAKNYLHERLVELGVFKEAELTE